ncbi:GGDEF domain-containing protein [Halomonas sp. McH1-25]|nr:MULTISPECIES: GGDEF domain-containing protein [unclassified Halomonas]MCG7601117.1 GGDEF domain-containing protein [Halomonas sp. McH1-25]MCP1342987.1 GGDEF domain-containing protein [Halomonas sp. FL8]MCP1360839.1 GGDEF domain-containing protein [Halomonas sp. BBD45]MCP1363672.1 GGDEF domain-containing protein [Halomonas sp. BBD48]
MLHIFFPVAGIFIVCHFYTRSQFKTDKTLMEKVFLDPLTGLWNREKLIQDFEIEKNQAIITGMPLTLTLIDLDNFKLINNNHGHDTGDAALVSLSNLLKNHMQGMDSIYRFGGEEFAIILKNTDASVAKRKTEEIRKALEEKTITHRETTLNITLSAGIAELGRDGQDWQAMYHSADKRLYACKRNGRNCVDNGTSV